MLLCLLAFAALGNALLTQGDIAFTAYNADKDGWSIVALATINAGEIIFFSDRALTGTTFATGNNRDGTMQWNVNSPVTAGTVVSFSYLNLGGTATASTGTLVKVVDGSSDFNLSPNADTVFAYQGTVDAPTVFLAAISTANMGNSDLGGSGLAYGTTAVQVTPSSELAAYTGTRTGQSASAFRTLVNTGSNWGTSISGAFENTPPDTAVFTIATAVVGDPHIFGANGIKFDFAGQPDAEYALFTSPIVNINMHLSPTGPETRFITQVGILYRGTSIVLDPWFKSRADEITAQFAKLNATATFDGWQMTLTFCNNHVLSVTPMHTEGENYINYFEFTLSVPGCHDSYGGPLGETYQCKYALGQKTFQWSSAREESFRIASLTSPSGTYRKDAECAHEDEFGGESLVGKSL